MSATASRRPAAYEIAALILRHRRILSSITRVELAKRYSGSALGTAWVFLYPALLLCVYLFVYMVVFKVRFPGYSELGYVIFVFAGLVPYIGFTEALTASCQSIRQNIHLVKNVMLPIELVPIRTVAASLPSQFVSIAVVVLLAVIAGDLSWHLLLLPVVLLLQVALLIGLAFILAALAVALPDVTYFVNLFLMLLMFVSPIGFKPDMVPARLSFLIYGNPVYYMIDVFRGVLIGSHHVGALSALIYAALCLGIFALGCAFFSRFKGALVDFE